MKKLRLLLFKDCNRSCAGCCNQYWDLDSLEICNSFKEYDVIMLTGGEPMLKPDLVRKVIKNIREENSKCKIYMYTAKTNSNEIYEILKLLDGICVTFHDQSDVHDFVFLDYMTSNTTDKSLRLNVFEGIDITKLYLDRWKVRTNIVWDTECPLPENEVLMRLES